MNKTYKSSYKVAEKELVSLSVYNVGFQKCQPGYQWGPGIRDHFLIHFILSGKGVYRVNKESYFLTSGDLFLVSPNTEVLYQADQEDPWEYGWVGFSGSDGPILLHALGFRADHPILIQHPSGAQVLKYLRKIYLARGNQLSNAVEMTGHLYALLSFLITNDSTQRTAEGTGFYVQQAIAYISARYSYDITIREIADYVGLSRSHLFRSFETVIGMSPKEYLTSFRIRQATYLLEHSDLSITSVANSVGFENSLYFSKIFHSQKGCSPTTYRKMLHH